MKLEIDCLFVELVYNVAHTNALNFIGEGVSFAMTAATYLEEDDALLNEIELCLDGRDETRMYGCEAVRIFDRRIEIDLGAQHLDKKYESISLLFQVRIPRQMIKFLNDCLFLGEKIQYDVSVDEELRLSQTEFRE